MEEYEDPDYDYKKRRAEITPRSRDYYRNPINQVEAEELLWLDLQLLEDLTQDYVDTCRALAIAESEYRKGKASSYLRSKGTNKDREMYADRNNYTKMLEYKTLQEEKESLNQGIWEVKYRIDTLRSMNKNIRDST